MPAFQQVFRAIVTADAGGAIREYRKYQSHVDKSTTAAAKQLGKTEVAMRRVKTAAAGIGITAGVALGRHAVNAARDLEESINAVNVMYGDHAARILKIGEGAAQSAGLSKRAFNESAVAVGGFVNQIAEVSGADTASVLDELITRASDFASVFNINVDEALQRFRSGLAGETEPLRRFGINLLQSEVNAYAAANGIGEVGRALTEEEKVLARFRLLLQKTNTMAGDFAATSGELANSQRIMRADLENLAAEFGDELVPAAKAAVEGVRAFATVLTELKVPEALGKIGELFGFISDAVGGTPTTNDDFDIDVDTRPLHSRLNEFASARQAVIDSFGVGRLAGGIWDVMDGGPDARWAETFSSTAEAFREIAELDPSAASQLLDDIGVVLANADAGNAKAQQWAAGVGLTHDSYESLGLILRAVQRPMKELTLDMAFAGMETQGLSRELLEAADNSDGFRSSIDRHPAALAAQATAARAAQIHLNILRLRLDEIKNSYDTLMGRLSDRQSLLGISDSIDRVEDLHAAWMEAEAGTEEAERAARDYETSLIDVQIEVGNYLTEVEGLPEEWVTDIVANIDLESLGEVETALGLLARGVTAPIFFQGITSGDQLAMLNALLGRPAATLPTPPTVPPSTGFDPSFNTGTGFQFDSGGIVPGPIGAPRMILAHGGETVLPTHKRGGMPSVNINVNAGMGADGVQIGREIKEALERYYRSGGTAPETN